MQGRLLILLEKKLYQEFGTLMGQRGGFRPGSGRKKKTTRVQKEERDELNKMVDARKLLLTQLHTEDLMKAFIEALKSAIVSTKASDRTWAMRILAEIYLGKGVLPEEVKDPNEGKVTLEDLLSEYRKKQSDVLSEDSGEQSPDT